MHRRLGPGLLESVYEVILSSELNKRGLKTERQVKVPIEFDGISFDEGFRADLIVEKIVIIELKSKQTILASDRKQIQTYLRLTGLKLGYLLNFRYLTNERRYCKSGKWTTRININAFFFFFFLCDSAPLRANLLNFSN